MKMELIHHKNWSREASFFILHNSSLILFFYLSQKCSDKYRLAPSQSTDTITPRLTLAATLRQPTTAAPDEMPTARPSSRVSRLAMFCASSVLMLMVSSANLGS